MLSLSLSQPQSPLANTLGSEALREMLASLIYELPQEQRHVVLLKYPLDHRWKTYSDEQIGTMLQVSSTWVRTLRRRAFVTLKERVSVLGTEL